MKQRLLLLVILCYGSVSLLSAQSTQYKWTKSIGGSSNDFCDRIVTDDQGHVYLLGRFANTVNFNPSGAGGTLTSAGGSDLFVAKYDTAGTFIWVRQMGGVEDERGSDIALDGQGGVYLTGSFQDTADFDPTGAGGTLISAGNIDAFLCKYDASGSFQWVKGFGGTGRETGIGVGFGNGNLYLTGSFGTTVDFNPGGSNGSLTTNGSVDAFVLALDQSGSFIWVKGWGGTYNDLASSIFPNASGQLLVIGTFSGTVDFDPGTGTRYMRSHFDGLDYDAATSISMLDASGSLLWSKQQGGQGASAAVDASGAIYLAGSFTGTANLDPDSTGGFTFSSRGYFDDYISKLSPTGAAIWVRQIGGTGDNSLLDLAVDQAGYVFVTGRFSGTADLDPGPDSVKVISAGDNVTYMLRLESNGNLSWSHYILGTDDVLGSAIAIDASRNVYGAGSYLGTADFNIGGAGDTLSVAGSNRDLYLTRFSQTGLATGLEKIAANPFLLYPNPVTSLLHIYQEESTTTTQLEITDMNGATVASYTIHGSNVNIDVSKLAAGIYTTRIISERAAHTRLFVKQ